VRAARRLLGAAAALMGAVGCSLPTDPAPQAIAPEDVPFGLLGESGGAPQAEPGPGTSTASLYFVESVESDYRLRAVTRVLETTGERERAVVESLLAGRADDDPVALTTSIPSGVRLLDIGREGDQDQVLVLDLSAELNSIVNPGLQQAVAQLTFTGLDLPDVTAVRFALEGEPFAAGAADGRPDLIDETDFPDLIIARPGNGAQG
jgi:hypothetical protein